MINAWIMKTGCFAPSVQVDNFYAELAAMKWQSKGDAVSQSADLELQLADAKRSCGINKEVGPPVIIKYLVAALQTDEELHARVYARSKDKNDSDYREDLFLVSLERNVAPPPYVI